MCPFGQLFMALSGIEWKASGVASWLNSEMRDQLGVSGLRMPVASGIFIAWIGVFLSH